VFYCIVPVEDVLMVFVRLSNTFICENVDSSAEFCSSEKNVQKQINIKTPYALQQTPKPHFNKLNSYRAIFYELYSTNIACIKEN
jgi:hypothetical protein